MDEIKTEEIKPEEKPEFSALEEADKKIKELEIVNKNLEDNIRRADKLLAENMLRGKSVISGNQKELTEDEKQIEEAKKMMEGTGLNPFR